MVLCLWFSACTLFKFLVLLVALWLYSILLCWYSVLPCSLFITLRDTCITLLLLLLVLCFRLFKRFSYSPFVLSNFASILGCRQIKSVHENLWNVQLHPTLPLFHVMLTSWCLIDQVTKHFFDSRMYFSHNHNLICKRWG